MFLTLKIKKIVNFPALVFFILAVGMTVLFIQNMTAAAPVSAPGKTYCLVIDAGHGGVDGGAIAISGAKESDINLAIALRLQKIADFYGSNTIMTRDSDKGVLEYSAGSYSEHNDLVRRVEIANSASNGVLMSIHQNFYPTAQPSGAQVLYASSDESKMLGTITHNNMIRFLDPENRRVVAPASHIYITSNAKCPAILVECGFMSNFSDLEKLLTNKYQTSLAAVLMASYLQYTSGASLA